MSMGKSATSIIGFEGLEIFQYQTSMGFVDELVFFGKLCGSTCCKSTMHPQIILILFIFYREKKIEMINNGERISRNARSRQEHAK